MTTKVCNTCEEDKSLDEFPRDSAKKDGRRNQCSLCRSMKRYPEKHQMNSYRKRTHVVVDGKKLCSLCKETKPVEEFYNSTKTATGYSYTCKVCQTAADKRSNKKDPTGRFRQYGITKEQFEQMLLDQDGKCKICSDDITKKSAIDHCHTTLKVRGLLCGRCNAGLGFFRDNTDYLRGAIEYLS